MQQTLVDLPLKYPGRLRIWQQLRFLSARDQPHWEKYVATKTDKKRQSFKFDISLEHDEKKNNYYVFDRNSENDTSKSKSTVQIL